MSTVQGEAATPSIAPVVRGPARPDWRWQRHTWFLFGLSVANVAIDWLAGRLVDGASSATEGLVVGVLLGQLFLMGLWMALGGLHVAARFGVIAATTICGTAAFWAALGRNDAELWNFQIYSGTIVLGTHALLLPLRALVGWRIDFDPAYHARSADAKLQIRLVHLIALTTACALPFALARGVDNTDSILTVAVFGGIGLAAAVPIAWIAVAARGSLRFWIKAVGMLFVSLLAHFFVVAEIMHSGIDKALFLYLGVVATVTANLGMLRLLFGLRLLSILDPAAPNAAANSYAPLDADLAAIVDAWPRLPAAVRNDVAQQVRSAASESGV